MATVTKFNDFSEQLSKGNHHFGTDTFKLMLSNTAPSAANTVKANITEISAGNGYTAGGYAVTVGISETSGTTTITGAAVTITASGGTMATFRYFVLYNDTSTGDLLVDFWDHGSGITLEDGSSAIFKFNSADPGTILTVA